MLQEIYYNNTLQSWLISAGIIVIALIINWIITIINSRYLKTLAKRTKNYIDNIVVNTLETPLKVGIILIAIWAAFSRLETSKQLDDILFKAYEILTVLNITWFIAHLVYGLVNEYFLRRAEKISNGKRVIDVDSHIVTLILKTCLFLIWTIGVITALSNAGLDIKAILGTLGLSGIAIALAAQDTVKNVFGGFTILLDGTFRIGDRIRIGEYEGSIEDIGVRSTKIRNYDKQLVLIPNYKIVEGAVINISAARQQRIVTKLGITYNCLPEQMNKALAILKDIAIENDTISNEGISAVFEDFGNFALNIRYCYFIEDSADKLQTVSAVNLEILKRFNQSGIEFALPAQSTII